MTPSDSLSLLLTLPTSRLCQMLCLVSRQHDIETAWASLVWIESERSKIPPLSRRAREQWRQVLFPGTSLERLLDQNKPFDPFILEMVTDTVFGLLFVATGNGPSRDALEAVLDGWNTRGDHIVLSLLSFLESLPVTASRQLLDLPDSEFLQVVLDKGTRTPEQQRTALLFQVLLHLVYAGALSDSTLLNLYRFEAPLGLGEWQRILEGLRTFPLILQARRRHGGSDL